MQIAEFLNISAPLTFSVWAHLKLWMAHHKYVSVSWKMYRFTCIRGKRRIVQRRIFECYVSCYFLVFSNLVNMIWFDEFTEGKPFCPLHIRHELTCSYGVVVCITTMFDLYTATPLVSGRWRNCVQLRTASVWALLQTPRPPRRLNSYGKRGLQQVAHTWCNI